MKNRKRTPLIKTLIYRKGDLIIKQGDYGISIYKILKGKVEIFKESGDREVILATLEPGEMIGEMTFISGPNVPRSASARALEDSELEVWHFSRLRKEYEEMPPVLKAMAKQTLERLIRTNNTLVNLDVKQSEAKKCEKLIPGESLRRFYRKEVDLDCMYRPLHSSPNHELEGRIKDISFGGMGVEVSARNGRHSFHKPGEVFVINSVLPNGRDFELTAKVTSVNESSVPGRFSMGMMFTDKPAWVKQRLGLYLLP